MSFFKRLKDKFSGKSEDDIQKELDESTHSETKKEPEDSDKIAHEEEVVEETKRCCKIKETVKSEFV